MREIDKIRVKHDLDEGHLEVKTKLLQEALTKRNKDYEGLEGNNK